MDHHSTGSRVIRALSHPTLFKASWMGLLGCTLMAALVVAFMVAKGAFAEQKSAAPPKAAPSQQVAPQPTYHVSGEQAVYLVRSTLATVNDANRSGNYSVLHNLATPDFQAKNTPADLAVGFLNLRRRNIDLFALSLTPPEFTAAPAIDPQGALRVTGFFPALPQRLNFDLIYRVVNGQWKLEGIALAMPEAPAPQAQVQPPAKPDASLAIAPTDDAATKPAADAAQKSTADTAPKPTANAPPKPIGDAAPPPTAGAAQKR
jgi:hypothetical protein